MYDAGIHANILYALTNPFDLLLNLGDIRQYQFQLNNLDISVKC